MGYGPNDLRALAGSNLYSIGPSLAFDLGAPGVRVVDLIDLPNHVAPSEQLSVVISAPHSCDEPFDPPLDLDRILHVSDPTPRRPALYSDADGATTSLPSPPPRACSFSSLC